MHIRRLAWCTTAALVFSGCQTMNAAADVPALIAAPDDASRAALRDTVSGIFGGQNVPLADDALTKQRLLDAEHDFVDGRVHDVRGAVAMGIGVEHLRIACEKRVDGRYFARHRRENLGIRHERNRSPNR